MMKITLSQVREIKNIILKFDQNQQPLLGDIHRHFYQMDQLGAFRKVRDHIEMTGVVWRELNETIATYTGDYDPLIDSIFLGFNDDFAKAWPSEPEKSTEHYANAINTAINKLYKYSQDLLLCVESANSDER
ncbi:hypothetical protein DET48_12346 [Vibrio diazotrophicus]|jgi:hypothetical protein|uniref:Uncharacterized protein n=2 Tax=Vibrio diazotrophicus TaxID=685 RepID=A0A329ECR1_VIBDI|nr:hypothetical protein DET48_12346 [Vibrio diazotrophicus]